eukprot:3486582-Amphidinium_carterae.1
MACRSTQHCNCTVVNSVTRYRIVSERSRVVCVLLEHMHSRLSCEHACCNGPWHGPQLVCPPNVFQEHIVKITGAEISEVPTR